MAHCGYEGTAVEETIANPLSALGVFLFGPRLDGEMAPELPVLHVARLLSWERYAARLAGTLPAFHASNRRGAT